MTKHADNFTKTRLAWLDRVVRDHTLSQGAFAMAYLISGHINRKSGDGWPGLQSLAALMGVNERTARRLINDLVSHGYISKRRRGDGKTNRYRLAFADRTEMSSLSDSRPDKSVHSEPIRPDISRHSDRTFDDIQTGQKCPPNSLKNSLSELSEEGISAKLPPERDLQSEFEKVWLHYPKKVSKGSARKAFKAARKRVDLETLLSGVQRYASERSGQDHKFTKHFSTWLTGECWGDEASTHRVAGPAASHPRTWQTGKDRNSEVVRRLVENDE